ncbi:MAG: carbohydrate kinase family protein [Candidatus Njordarchaeia archaeon]
MVADFLVVGDVVIDIIADLGIPFEEIRFAASMDLKSGKITPGGGGNIAAAMGYLGNNVLFLGKGGNDVLCHFYEDDLRNYGVEPLILKSEEKSTGYVISLISSDVERTMLVYPGANEDLKIEEIEKLYGKLKQFNNLFVHGYSLQRPKQAEAILFLVECFHDENKRIFFDPSTSTLIEKNRAIIETMLEHSNGILLNIDEAISFTKKTALEDIVEFMTGICDLVALKMGHKGSLIIDEMEIYWSPPYIVKPVDPTGAGDAYDAAFLSLYLETGDIKIAADFANWFSAQTITKYGPRTFPSKKEIENKIRKIRK